MTHRSLAEFLEQLADRDQLARVGSNVSPVLELAEIARRVSTAGGAALLFDRVEGSGYPIVANVLGTLGRACQALGVSRLEELSERTATLLRQAGPGGWLERLRLSGEAPPAERLRPKPARNAPCQQVVRLGRDIDLTKLGVLKLWPGEAGGLITAAHVVFSDAAGNRRLLPSRLHVVDATHAAVVDDPHGELARAQRAAETRGEKLPLAVFLGGDPAYRLASAAPVAETLDPYLWLALVRGAALDVTRGRSVPLEVPADADMVLEGTVVRRLDAPSVASETSGHYQRSATLACLQVEAITQRSGCLLPAAIPMLPTGAPAATAGSEAIGEQAVLTRAVEQMLLPLVRSAIGELVDYALPGWGGQDRYAFLSLQKEVPHGARRAASALWGLPAFQGTRFVVLVDADVDVHDAAQVWSRVAANVDPGRDVWVHDGPTASDDHAFDLPGAGRQLGIDATRKLPGEAAQAGPEPLAVSPEIRDLVDRRWKEYGLA